MTDVKADPDKWKNWGKRKEEKPLNPIMIVVMILIALAICGAIYFAIMKYWGVER